MSITSGSGGPFVAPPAVLPVPPLVPGGAAPPLQLLASTGAAGFALVNGVPGILSVVFPLDGNLHRFIVFAYLAITTLEVGGAINVNLSGGGGFPASLYPGAQAAGLRVNSLSGLAVASGGANSVTVQQASALTGGAATLFAEIWGL